MEKETKRHWVRSLLAGLARRLRDESLEIHRQIVEETAAQRMRETAVAQSYEERFTALEARVDALEDRFQIIWEVGED